MNTDVECSQNTVKRLYDKYKEDEYMTKKLNTYLQKQLEVTMENIKKEQIERNNRLQELSSEQEEFVHRFIENKKYYYCSLSELFFKYDGINYIHSSEDIVMNDVLESVTKGGKLIAWKQKTKINVMKKIKDQNVFYNIPESTTIQNVLEALTPVFFRNKAETKYFLTVIGDNILKKNTHLNHFITPIAKQFIKCLNNQSQKFFEVGLNQSIKYKYKDHDYKTCRILSINDCVKNELLWSSVLDKNYLNILCVACHYSVRFRSSDMFILNHSNDTKLNEKIMYISNTNSDKLINEFIEHNIDKETLSVIQNKSNKTAFISWKNMQYLWKLFLERKNIPSVIFLNALKTKLISILSDYYDEETDCFYHLYSKNLPSIQKFLDFWNTQIVYDENESDLEIDEILSLLKKWSNVSFNEEQLVDLLSYYFPAIEIDENKFIHGISCKLWDKQGEIQNALVDYKNKMAEKYSNTPISPRVGLSDVYIFYCKRLNQGSVKIVANKMYFEKYVNETFQEYIIDNKFLRNSWYLQD